MLACVDDAGAIAEGINAGVLTCDFFLSGMDAGCVGYSAAMIVTVSMLNHSIQRHLVDMGARYL